MKKNNIKCSECEHCNELRTVGNTRSGFSCGHPDQKYIYDYFAEHKIAKMAGFLGFGKRWAHEVPVKTSPAWCPKKKNLN